MHPQLQKHAIEHSKMAPIPTADSEFLYTERISQYVSLPPAALATPLPALCASVFSPLLLSYFPPARGIILAYEDVTLSSSPHSTEDHSEPVMLRHIDEYSSPFLWATATFLIWRPQHNKWITGRITHQSKTHITLSYLNIFPVSVLSTHLPPSWTFEQTQTGTDSYHTSDEGGVWVGEDGEIAGDLRVRLLDFDGRTDGKAKGKGMRLEGSLLSEQDEKRKEKEKGKGKAKRGILKAQSSQEIDV